MTGLKRDPTVCENTTLFSLFKSSNKVIGNTYVKAFLMGRGFRVLP